MKVVKEMEEDAVRHQIFGGRNCDLCHLSERVLLIVDLFDRDILFN
jgi:hypothetical protein